MATCQFFFECALNTYAECQIQATQHEICLCYKSYKSYMYTFHVHLISCGLLQKLATLDFYHYATAPASNHIVLYIGRNLFY